MGDVNEDGMGESEWADGIEASGGTYTGVLLQRCWWCHDGAVHGLDDIVMV